MILGRRGSFSLGQLEWHRGPPRFARRRALIHLSPNDWGGGAARSQSFECVQSGIVDVDELDAHARRGGLRFSSNPDDASDCGPGRKLPRNMNLEGDAFAHGEIAYRLNE